jgi:hypothetical protein
MRRSVAIHRPFCNCMGPLCPSFTLFYYCCLLSELDALRSSATIQGLGLPLLGSYSGRAAAVCTVCAVVPLGHTQIR